MLLVSDVFFRKSIKVIGKPKISSAISAYISIMFFQSIRKNPSEKNVEESECQKTTLPDANYCAEPLHCVFIHLNCAYSIVIENFKIKIYIDLCTSAL